MKINRWSGIWIISQIIGWSIIAVEIITNTHYGFLSAGSFIIGLVILIVGNKLDRRRNDRIHNI
jgi:hypothetical protein